MELEHCANHWSTRSHKPTASIMKGGGFGLQTQHWISLKPNPVDDTQVRGQLTSESMSIRSSKSSTWFTAAAIAMRKSPLDLIFHPLRIIHVSPSFFSKEVHLLLRNWNFAACDTIWSPKVWPLMRESILSLDIASWSTHCFPKHTVIATN